MLGFDLETYPIGPKRAPEVIVGFQHLMRGTKFQR